ncbi:ABC transporter ATP-binding protein [Hansschlegelia quercus]|uniref:ABC transporter ATP-binding protein n=1 Tax=Hansschlegelia quercus TaxID=2528245 RepID=A0A4Q9GST2_9HYPH|nr:ABC transporter ATP-binding protein [Hansschlegelia quercus]TBN55270.1 ABC transporter ATP-binding protein [Hansschlegelia quercus]
MTPNERAGPAIAIRSLSVSFTTPEGPIHALQDVDLDVTPGDFVSLIGPSGCGKTTLMRLVADLERPTAGTISIGGLAPEQARERRAYGYVFQQPALYPWRTIERNVTLPLEVMGAPKAERRERARKSLEQVGLSGFERRFPWQLSGGMQQRASIARALAFDAGLLLMDEPFGALDEIVRDRLNVELHELWERTGKTALFVTHSIQEAVFLSTKIVVMSPRPGKIVEVIDASSLPRKRALELRETPEFLEVARRVRDGLRAGHAYD